MFFIFFKKNYLPSVNQEGTRQRFFIFFKKFLCRVPTRKALGKELLFFLKIFFAECQHARHSAKFNFFLISLPSVIVTALGKAGKSVFWSPILPALPSVLTIALGKGVLCRVQHSAKWPKTANNFFFCVPSWQIHSYKHISHIYLIHHIYISSIAYISHPSHIYLIHPHIHPPISHPSQYIIISAQVHPNKFTSPSKSTSASQVHHQVNNKCKKYNMHSSRPLRLWWRPRCIIRRCMRWIIRTTVRWRLHKGEKIACETKLFW